MFSIPTASRLFPWFLRAFLQDYSWLWLHTNEISCSPNSYLPTPNQVPKQLNHFTNVPMNKNFYFSISFLSLIIFILNGFTVRSLPILPRKTEISHIQPPGKEQVYYLQIHEKGQRKLRFHCDPGFQCSMKLLRQRNILLAHALLILWLRKKNRLLQSLYIRQTWHLKNRVLRNHFNPISSFSTDIACTAYSVCAWEP